MVFGVVIKKYSLRAIERYLDIKGSLFIECSFLDF